jgi:inorganic pyrophosphatase
VRDVADSCRTGAATNVIFGLALGYKSVIVPVFAIAVSIYVSFTLASIYGIAVAALGMLSTVATGLAIDAYGPISDNAGGIAEMAGMSHRIRQRTDALDAAGNTTAAIGKVDDTEEFDRLRGITRDQDEHGLICACRDSPSDRRRWCRWHCSARS